MLSSVYMALTNTTTVEFPGLGIPRFSFDRAAIRFSDTFAIYWYGVIIMLGIAVAVFHAWYRSRQEGVSSDDLMDLALFTVLSGIIGARAYYVLTSLDKFDSFGEAIAIWDGGLGIYGGIIAGIAAIIVTCLVKKLNPLRVLDMVGPGVMIAQAIGRWGNFCNGEAYGYEVAEGSFLYPFRMGVLSDFTYTGDVMHYYHPTFLYESLWNVVGFVLITLLYRKKKFQGQMALSYLAWYGFGRSFIELLRTDSLPIPGTDLRISHVLGAVCFIVGTAAIVTGLILQKKGKLPPIFDVSWAQPQAAKAEAEADETEINQEINTEENQDNGDE